MSCEDVPVLRKRRLCLFRLLIIVWLFGSITGVLIAESSGDPTGGFAPHNRFFTAESTSSGVNQDESPCCDSGPLRTSPLDLSHMIGKKITAEEMRDQNLSARIEVELPSRYDLRDYGKVPPIRDQGASGSCWDFASIKSLESSFLPGYKEDFSENNLKNHVSAYYPDGFDYADGGNDLMAAAYFNRWAGPVPDRLDPYNPYSSKSPDNLPVSAHVAEIPMLPGRSGPLDNGNIKNGVMQYGCLYTTLSFDYSYYNEDTAAYYNKEATIADHAVSIVGWDDNFPKSRFLQEAPGDGAFICANSWGTSFGDNGFFYISYYDTLVGKTVSAFTGSASDDYDGNYGYDPLGWVSSFGFGIETASAANVFRAEKDELIEAVGFYVPQVDSIVSIGIYIEPDSGPVSSRGPDIYETRSYQVPGYHIYKFDTPVPVRKGEDFSVEIGFITPDYGYPVPVEYAFPGYSSKATASPGQSWVKASGGAWSDLTKWDATANACIRAYTRRTTGPKADFYAEPISGTPPLTVQFTDVSSGAPQRWLWQFGDGETSTEQNPSHTYTQVGRYTVSLTVDRPGGESKTVKENYISTTTPSTITVPDDHSLIQDAVDAAQEGSTIRVRYGYYPEKLTISKPLTLIGLSNVEGQKPIIDALFKGTPVSITGADVTLDGFSITGGYSDYVIRPGIAVRGNRAKIVNNWIFENYAGIWCENVSSVVIDGNIIWNSSAEGFYSESSSDIAIYNNTVMLSSSTQGILMVNGQRGIIRGNVIADNAESGLGLLKVHGLAVYDNYFNNMVNTVIGSDVSCSWNTVKTSGINIVKGPYIGGNYWAAPDGSGFSETHQDLDGDGFCDEPFTFDGQTDSLPLASPGGETVVADFEAAPREGKAPLTVKFGDKSTGPVQSWRWEFGDGSFATDQQPSHLYYLPGSYAVSLTVTGGGLSHTTTRSSYITVTGTGPDYQLPLSAGWNLIAIPRPLLSGTDTAALFADLNTDGHSIFTFTDSSWVMVKRDDRITPLSGYWIFSKEPAILPLYFNKVYGTPERVLNFGWNLIGSPRQEPVSAKTAMSSLGNSWAYLIGFNRYLQKYDDVIIRGGTGINSDEREINPGSGYWLFMENSGTIQAFY